MAVGYQVVANALTNPPSYTCRVVPSKSLGYDEVAAQINLHNPTIPVSTAKTVLEAFREEVKLQLADGNTVNLANFVSFVTTMPVKLASATDSLPSNPISVSAKPSTTFKGEVQQAATYTRLATPVKAPTLNAAFDASTGIDGFCRNGYGLRISGSNLRFNADDSDQGVFLMSQAGNDMRQDNISLNDPSNLIVIPGLDPATQPAGAASVEHVLSVRSKYTDNGTLRSGGYSKKMRTTNVISDTNKKLFVTGAATSGPAVVKTYSGSTVNCRILAQVQTTGELTLAIAPLSGSFGQAMTVAANGDFVLAGLAANVTVTVTDWEALAAAAQSYGRYFVEFCNISALTP
jgi:nucleoid DNA-binding protein